MYLRRVYDVGPGRRESLERPVGHPSRDTQGLMSEDVGSTSNSNVSLRAAKCPEGAKGDAADLTVSLCAISGSIGCLPQCSTGSSLPCYEVCRLRYSNPIESTIPDQRANLAGRIAHGAARGVTSMFRRCSGAEARAVASLLWSGFQALE